MNFIDTFTVWHLRVLKFLDSPIEEAARLRIDYPDRLNDGLFEALQLLYPQLKNREDLIMVIENDLQLRELNENGIIRGEMEKASIQKSYTTLLGKGFLQFITSPISFE